MGCGNNKGQSLSVVVNKQQMMKKVSLNAQSEDDNAHIIEAGKKFKSYNEDVFDREISKRLESKNNISESLAKINEDDAKPKEIEIVKVNLQLNLIEPVKQKLSLGVYEHKFDFDLDPSARKEGESSGMISQVIHELNEI